EGWTGTDWIVLDTVEGQSGWQRGQRYYFEIINNRAFSKYRWNLSGPQDPDSTTLDWGGFAIHQKAENQTPSALVASSTAGINNGEGFQPSDVGRPVRLMGPNSKWIWA